MVTVAHHSTRKVRPQQQLMVTTAQHSMTQPVKCVVRADPSHRCHTLAGQMAAAGLLWPKNLLPNMGQSVEDMSDQQCSRPDSSHGNEMCDGYNTAAANTNTTHCIAAKGKGVQELQAATVIHPDLPYIYLPCLTAKGASQQGATQSCSAAAIKAPAARPLAALVGKRYVNWPADATCAHTCARTRTHKHTQPLVLCCGV